MIPMAANHQNEQPRFWGCGFGRLVRVLALALAVVVIFVPSVAPALVPLSHGHAMGGRGM
jgi:hypothetical protein